MLAKKSQIRTKTSLVSLASHHRPLPVAVSKTAFRVALEEKSQEKAHGALAKTKRRNGKGLNEQKPTAADTRLGQVNFPLRMSDVRPRFLRGGLWVVIERAQRWADC